MSRPWTVQAGLALLAMAAGAAASGCGGDERPSPGLSERYDVVIAICADRLSSVNDVCDRLTESDGDRVVANVIFGRAGGHDVSVRTEVTEGGNAVDEPAPRRVPANRSWLQGVFIDRQTACAAAECRLVISAIVDGQTVSDQEFRFVAS